MTTRSPIAYRLYEEGLRAFYQGDPGAALRLFRAALAADSSFALAAYHGYRAAVAVGDTGVVGLATHALQVASRATDRDRLLIRAHLGADQSDPAAVFAAESLIARYPNDPEALTRGAVVFSNDVGRLPLVTTLLDRVIREDSAAGSGQTGPCRLCEALTALTTIYVWADSAAALERVYRRWLALRPRDGFAWHGLAGALWWLGQQAQSDQAVRQGDALGASDANPITRVLVRGLQHDELTGIDDLCRSGLASANPTTLVEYRWYCILAWRTEGRYRDADRLMREGRVTNGGGGGGTIRGLPADPLLTAILDWEMGRPSLAAAAFQSLAEAVQRRPGPLGVQARDRVWMLTLAATARVAADDTLRARALVDSIQAVGSRSLYPRDPRLHYFIRGLLSARVGNHADAIELYRRAVGSWTFGYTRVNAELARSAMAIDRPADAIYPLQAALRGGVEGPNLYITRTELHELLAQAFDRVGAADSAGSHYRAVERYWRGSDPSLQPRYRAARDWLAGHGRLAQ